jgi:hypothetical protein
MTEQTLSRNKFEINEQNKLCKYETTGKIMNNNRLIMNNEVATNNDAGMGALAHEQN